MPRGHEVLGGGRPAVAEEVPVLDPAGVDVHPAQTDAESAGEGGLDRPGVRAGVAGGVAAPRPGGAARVGAQRHGQRCGEPGGRQVRDVVQPRRRPAEVPVARAAVADHRVEGVHGAVAEQSGRPEHGTPHQRRDHGIGGVLRDRLDRGARDTCLVERGGLASHDPCYPTACCGQVARDQTALDGCRLAVEGRTAEHHPSRHRGADRALRKRSTDQDRAAHQQRDVDDAVCAVVAVAALFDRPGETAEARHRMPSGRIGEQTVGGEPERQPGPAIPATHRRSPCRCS